MFAFLATFACGAFFGAAPYVSVVQVPAMLEIGAGFAGRFFEPMYRRAARMAASLAVLGAIAALLSWLTGSGAAWFVGGVLLFAVIPVTFLWIMPINRRLLDPNQTQTSLGSEVLLQRWGRLHTVRTALGGLAFVLFLAKLALA